MKILVHGFPHSGTTILKSIIENHPEVKGQTLESKVLKKDFNLIKWPYTENEFLGEQYRDFKKVFIIRNPYYIISSMNRRYGRFDYESVKPSESFESWESTVKKWIQCKSREDFLCIRYEDLFDSNYKTLKNIFSFLGLEFKERFMENPQKKYRVTNNIDSPDQRPKARNHAQFRTWQINQKFKNMNHPSKVQLSEEQYHMISNSECLKAAGYINLEKENCVKKLK